MSRRVLARNAVWNIAGTAVEAVTGFVLAPFLIRHLGETTFGLWVILGSLAGYFGLLDLGIRGSVGRHVALYHAQQDQSGINRIVSTALAFLGAAAFLAIAGMIAVRSIFDNIYTFPAELGGDVHAALLVVGATMAVLLLSNTFDATLWGFQRFDILSMVDIPAAFARLGLTFFIISNDAGLFPLAVINLTVTVAVAVLKAILCFRENADLRIGPQFLSGAAAREIFGYGLWSFVHSLSRTVRVQLGPLLIGAMIGVASATPYSIGNRLVMLMATVLVALTGIFTPYATRLHAQEKTEQQQRLFIIGGRFCLAMTLFMGVGLIVLGNALITLWVGAGLAFASTLLVILTVGEILPSSQYVTAGIIFAKAAQRPLALLGIIEATLVAGLLFWLLPVHGLVGACWAVALPGIACRGVGVVWQGCLLLEVSPARYGMEALFPSLLCSLLPGALLAGATALRPPEGWAEVMLYSTGYTAMFGICCLPLLGAKAIARGLILARIRPASQTVAIIPESDESACSPSKGAVP